MGDEVANNQVIFEPNRNEGKLRREEYNRKNEHNKLDWNIPAKDQHYLYERNFEVHQIVDFIFSRYS